MKEEKNKIQSPALSKKKGKWGLTSLMCGIVSWCPWNFLVILGLLSADDFIISLCDSFFFNFFLPIIAIFFGIAGLRKEEKRGLSILGVIIGSLRLITYWLFS